MLLADAEASIERVLHLVRLCVFLVASAFGLFGFGLMDPRLWAAWSVLIGGFLVLWIVVWRRLGRGQTSLGLGCGLILLDGFLIARGVLLLSTRAACTDRVPDAYRMVLSVISRADVEAITPPMLVFLAMSGSFRLDPRLAVFSTVVALAVYAYLRAVFPAPPNQAFSVGVVVLASGALGANAARVIRYMTLKASQERVLRRYVPASLTEEILRSGEPEHAARVEEVTVLMSDIRGFTRLSESLGPEAAVRLLNDCFGVLVAPLAEEGAVLDKYLGDGILSFFEGAGHGERALRAGRAMLASLDAWNASRPEETRLRIGVAIHAGRTLLGTIGAGSRRDYTLIGDVVNVTARLEELNKRFGSTMIVSADALRLAPGDA
jgi:class 3 adenylate cyclase